MSRFTFTFYFNNVEATLNFVEATFDFVERIVRLVAFDTAASTLLVVWTGLNGVGVQTQQQSS